jgi:hypothetical protein
MKTAFHKYGEELEKVRILLEKVKAKKRLKLK